MAVPQSASSLEEGNNDRSVQLLQAHYEAICLRQDFLLSVGLILQWIGCILLTLWNSDGLTRPLSGYLHSQLWVASLLGGSIVGFSLAAARLFPGSTLSRHSLALGQMLFCTLLSYLMKGSIEAQFHVFSALAFLALYRDWKVLVTASAVVVVDHIGRGWIWPDAIYGTAGEGLLRTFEYSFWVGIEDLFLILSCLKSQAEMKAIATQRAEIEFEKSVVEEKIDLRTQELVEYGNFLRGVIDGIDAGICILDATGIVVATNATWLNYGSSAEQDRSRVEVGMNYLEICRGSIGESSAAAIQIAEGIEGVLQGKSRTFSSEYPTQTSSEQKWTQVRISRVVNPDKVGAIVIHLDITQRMKAVEELQEQKRQVDQLAMVAQCTTNGVMITDAHQRVTWANESCTRLLGLPMAELLTRSIDELLLNPQSRSVVRNLLTEHLEKGLPFRSEMTCKRPDGSEVILDTEIQPIFSNDRLTGYIVNQNETTEQAILRERLTSIFAALAEGILVQNREGKIIDCNPEAELILGAARPELIDQLPNSGTWKTIFEDGSHWPCEDHPSMVTLRTGIPIRDAIMGIRQKRGGMRWISINTQVIKSGTGQANSVISSFTDVTTRREQMQRLDLTISGAGLGVWDLNLITESVRFNSIFARMLGYGSSEIRPTRPFWESLIHPEDKELAHKQLALHLLGESPDYRCEYRMKNRQGHWQWVLASGRIVERDSEGQPLRMTGVHIDIANIKEMEIKLRESENRMRLIFDTAMDAVVSLDRFGMILDWNRQAEQIFGFSRDYAVGKSLSELIGPAEVDPNSVSWTRLLVAAAHQRTLKRRFETTAFRQDRKILTVEMAVTPVSLNGTFTYSVFLRDITQKKQLEFQVSQTQRLESIGQLASGVAHEINTPVQFVNDSVFFVREGVQDLFELIDQLQTLIADCEAGKPVKEVMVEASEARENADLEYLSDNLPKAIDRSIDGLSRVAEIVRSMKEFAHQGSKEMNGVDLNRSLMSTLIVAKNEYKYVADVETQLSEIPEVICHGGEINQVFLNLIVNAAHAIADVVKDSGKKGKIRLESKVDGEFVEFSIADTGNGIPPSVRDRIFEPFFTTKEVGLGTGQGLAIAHSVVVQKHGGDIHFETEVGKGTKFYIRLRIDGPKKLVEAEQP